MIRSYFGLTDNPFSMREIQLLPHQQEIHDTLRVHCQQGGLCLVVGRPGTGKTEVVPFFGATRELAPLMRPLQTLPASDSLVMSDGAVCCSS